MKVFLVSLSLLFAFSIANAQTKFSGGFSFGLAVSQISGDDLSGFNKPGAIAGIYGYYNFNDKSWLQAEINFIQKGSYKAPKSEDPTKYVLNLNYVEVPLLYKFMPIGTHFVFELGPAFGLLINDKERSEIGDINLNVPFKKYEVAAVAGINYRFGKGWLVNFRGEQSVVPVRNHQGNAVFRINRGQYSSALCLTLRYDFGYARSQNK